MNKERKKIPTNATVFFDRDVAAEELNLLFGDNDFQRDIIITGNLHLGNVDLFLKCNNLYVMGEITVNKNTITEIEGNLWVEGSIDCFDLRVNGSVYCYGDVLSMGIEVSEDFFVNEIVDAYDANIYVGGDFICNDEITADEIVVLKKLEVKGNIQAYKIKVG